MRNLLLLLLLTSCGYHFGTGEEISRRIAVPYVEGDDFGLLTAALVRSVNHQGDLVFTSRENDYKLKVCLSPPRDENVGFWYAPRKSDVGYTNIIVPMEARVTLTAKIELYDCRNNCRVMGPCKVSAFLDYDFNSDLTNINQHAFSLGQLEMHNIAKNFAMRSLYDQLAEKIVDYVAYSW
ncbi:MAG: hypothetical protein H7A36_04050 [Chlamydiales bacterium]|nr:hypothetical protein [Chlamydiales bacterium]